MFYAHSHAPRLPAVARHACVFVSVCATTDCQSIAPAYLFAHSAVDRPVSVGKGREGKGGG